jgi:hypothetical protein
LPLTPERSTPGSPLKEAPYIVPGDPLRKAIASTAYIPLPLRLADPQSGPLVAEPTASDIGSLFGSSRTVLEIVGPGGAGKTTLARQIGNWVLHGGRPGGFPGHAMLPVWIDEDLDPKEKPLDKVVKDKLRALLPDEKLEDEILGAMLRKQRLLIIVDRLSERSAATQQYIESIYRSTRVEALLITTRREIRPEYSAPVLLYPQPLDEGNLLRFMTSLVAEDIEPQEPQTQPDAESKEAGVSATLSSLDSQLALGTRLKALFESTAGTDGNKPPIIPLPVRLFVEDAKRLIRLNRSLDELPSSIPEVYFNYLEQVNPREAHVPNFMTHEEMLKAAMALAKLALAGDFVPKEFFRDEAVNMLRGLGWSGPEKTDPIRRLIDNGVLMEKSLLVFRRLRFVLDPVAENLAAAAYVRACRADPACLNELREKSAGARGFRAALELFATVPF